MVQNIHFSEFLIKVYPIKVVTLNNSLIYLCYTKKIMITRNGNDKY